MSFVRRFVNLVFYTVIVTSVIVLTVVIANCLLLSNSNDEITVKTLNSKKVAKVQFIPTYSKKSHDASISNAILTPRAKKPIVITI